MNMAEAKPVTSKQVREVKNLGVPVFGRIANNIYTVLGFREGCTPCTL